MNSVNLQLVRVLFLEFCESPARTREFCENAARTRDLCEYPARTNDSIVPLAL